MPFFYLRTYQGLFVSHLHPCLRNLIHVDHWTFPPFSQLGREASTRTRGARKGKAEAERREGHAKSEPKPMTHRRTCDICHCYNNGSHCYKGPSKLKEYRTWPLQYDVISVHCVKMYFACEVVAFYMQEGLMQTSSLAEMNLLFLSFMLGLWIKVVQIYRLVS